MLLIAAFGVPVTVVLACRVRALPGRETGPAGRVRAAGDLPAVRRARVSSLRCSGASCTCPRPARSAVTWSTTSAPRAIFFSVGERRGLGRRRLQHGDPLHRSAESAAGVVRGGRAGRRLGVPDRGPGEAADDRAGGGDGARCSRCIGALQLFNEPTTLKPLANAISSTWVPLMRVYTDAFVDNSTSTSGAATSFILITMTVAATVLVNCRRPRLGPEAGPMTTLAVTRPAVVQDRASRKQAHPLGADDHPGVGALYCVVPVLWIVIAATKSQRLSCSRPPPYVPVVHRRHSGRTCMHLFSLQARHLRPLGAQLGDLRRRRRTAVHAIARRGRLCAGRSTPSRQHSAVPHDRGRGAAAADRAGDPAVPAAGQVRHDEQLRGGVAAAAGQPVRDLPLQDLRRGLGAGRDHGGGPDRRRRASGGCSGRSGRR